MSLRTLTGALLLLLLQKTLNNIKTCHGGVGGSRQDFVKSYRLFFLFFFFNFFLLSQGSDWHYESFSQQLSLCYGDGLAFPLLPPTRLV